jgi:FtsP/CotA-like multicopper oxidase with cupredoxin domain
VIGGMAGFLIVKGGPGTLDELPEIKAAKDLVMGFQVIRAGVNGEVPFVNQEATQFGTFPFGTTDPLQQGVFSTYGLDGAAGRSYFDFTTNGATNPTLHMRPGEVQRWRMLNAAQAETLVVALQGHGLNIIAMDALTVGNMYSLPPGTPVLMSPGQRYDILVKADKPGTYLLQALDPATPVSVSPSGIDPTSRASRQSFDFPDPCSTSAEGGCDPSVKASYPASLATIVVDGDPVNMALPTGPLPVPEKLPSVDTMLNRTPDAKRTVAFEICGEKAGTSLAIPQNRLPSCGWYFAKYDEKFWGGLPFKNLLLMRDDDDKGVPSEPFDPNMPRVAFEKEGLFTPEQPLFNNMIAGNYEEWTVVNRSFSDHPFHIHQNPFLLTHINGKALPIPEWHDTLIVPGSIPQPAAPEPPQPNINTNPHNSITFRTYFEPNTAGCFVMHCHILSHEDVSMMQRLDLLPGPNQPSLCMPEGMSH